jgi:hypothetical protein
MNDYLARIHHYIPRADMTELDVHAEPSPNPDQVSVAHMLEYRLRQQRLAAEFGYFALKTQNISELLQEATRLAALGLNATHAKYLQPLGIGWKPGVIGNATVGDEALLRACFPCRREVRQTKKSHGLCETQVIGCRLLRPFTTGFGEITPCGLSV